MKLSTTPGDMSFYLKIAKETKNFKWTMAAFVDNTLVPVSKEFKKLLDKLNKALQ